MWGFDVGVRVGGSGGRTLVSGVEGGGVGGWGRGAHAGVVWLGCGTHASSLEGRALQELEAACDQVQASRG